MNKSLLIALSCLALASSCQSAAPPPTPTLLPAETAIPTTTPTSTPTRTPTKTPLPPTPTVQPPSVLSDYLTNVRVVRTDDFHSAGAWNTYNSATGHVANGVYVITGQPGWASGLVRKAVFREGQGLVLEFKFANGTRFEFILDTGQWETDSYRRFGVFGFGYPQANLTQGRNAIGYKNLSGNFRPQPETWYHYMAAVGEGGIFLALIWDPDNPSHTIYYREGLSDKWAGLSWEFTAKAADAGMTLFLDNYAELSFSAIK